MNIADLNEAREFMERVNTWFYKTCQRDIITTSEDVKKQLNILSDLIQKPTVSERNLCVLLDISCILIQQLQNVAQNTAPFFPCNSISQSCNNINEIGKLYPKRPKNESLLISGSKYKSLDTLAGCFTSVEAAGSLGKSHTDVSYIGNNTCNGSATGIPAFNSKMLDNSHTEIHNVVPIIVTPDNKDSNGLKRESTWELGVNSTAVTSSPVSSIADGIEQISLDEIEGDVVLKICKETKTNMDRIERLLKKSLNRTHNLSKASAINVATNSVAKQKLHNASPQIGLKSVGRFSLGAARLPVPRKYVVTPKTVESPKKSTRPRTNTHIGAGASAVLQSASRNIVTAKRRISSLTSLKDFAPQNGTKLKNDGKGNSVSNIPSLRSNISNSPRTSAKIDTNMRLI